MPLVSLIVPVYKAEKWLHRCVDSILAQTMTDFELLLIDDGSPDRSGEICDEYAKQDILRQLEEDKPCEELRNYMDLHSISKEQLKKMLNENKFN